MALNPDQIFEQFQKIEPWKRFDEFSFIWIEIEDNTPPLIPVFFMSEPPDTYEMVLLRGKNAPNQFRKFREGEWTPEFGLDFGTADGIALEILNDQPSDYWAHRPGCPPERLRLDEKQILFQCMEAISYLVEKLDQEKLPSLDEQEFAGFRLWKVAGTWRAEVAAIPEEEFSAQELKGVHWPTPRVDRIIGVKFSRDGVWEMGSFYLPVTRVQGDSEVYVQCAAVVERSGSLLDGELLALVTMEANADPVQEIAEALLGAIEKQNRLPKGVLVRDETQLERLVHLTMKLGIPMRFRRKLPHLEHIRESLISDFPEEE